MTSDEARRDLRRGMDHAFSHDRPGGAHHHLNIEGFMNQLERYIDLRIAEALRRERGSRK